LSIKKKVVILGLDPGSRPAEFDEKFPLNKADRDPQVPLNTGIGKKLSSSGLTRGSRTS
jgi:hypothetical protein